MKTWLLPLGLITLCLAATSAVAQDVYNNGPTDGEDLGWTINFGFGVSDQFTLGAGGSLVNGIQFAAWLFPGDTLQTVDVSITSSEFGGTTFFSSTVNFTTGTCFSNGGFNVCNESGSFGPVNLEAGSYWLNLDNGVVNSGDPVYWDMNSGPSAASQSSLGTIPSESFTILGGETTTATTVSTTGTTTPEPSGIMLFGSGILGLAGVLRRTLF